MGPRVLCSLPLNSRPPHRRRTKNSRICCFGRRQMLATFHAWEPLKSRLVCFLGDHPDVLILGGGRQRRQPLSIYIYMYDMNYHLYHTCKKWSTLYTDSGGFLEPPRKVSGECRRHRVILMQAQGQQEVGDPSKNPRQQPGTKRNSPTDHDLLALVATHEAR